MDTDKEEEAQIVADQQQIEAKADQVEEAIDNTVEPDPQDTVPSVKVNGSPTIAAETAISMAQEFDEVVVITCHGCKYTRDAAVEINNLFISLLETARTGTTANVPVITNFGPPNIPSVLKRINERVKQTHSGTPTTLQDVYDIVGKHTGGSYHPVEAFFAEGSEFVFLTPTPEATARGHFEIHEARLFGTGCVLRHSGIFKLDQDGEVEDITFNFGLEPKPVARYQTPTKNCNQNIGHRSHKAKLQDLIDRSRKEVVKIRDALKSITSYQQANQLTLSPDEKALIDKRIKRYNRFLKRYLGDIKFLNYKLEHYGYIESGSHQKYDPNLLADKNVKLSYILNHPYFKKDGTRYLVLLHVCKVTCDQTSASAATDQGLFLPDENDNPLRRTGSLQSPTVGRVSFGKGKKGVTQEPGSNRVTPYIGGNLNRRKSGSKKKKARTRAARAVTQTTRNRTKKRGTRNKNNNTNKRRKN
jgi:hypothetical protein